MKKISCTTKVMYHIHLLISLVLSLIMFMIIGCSSPTSPKGKLIGQVNIEGLTDYSNATVAIYHLVALDTTLVRINQSYPSIGVHINQMTEFDFREHTPMQTTLTNADGTFSFSDIKPGNYNIVVKKSGFGYKIFYDLELTTGTNDLNTASDDGSIVLYPETTVSGLITANMTLLSDHHYIMNGDVNFDQSSLVTIQPGAVIRIAPGGSLIFYGQISVQGSLDNMIRFTSNDGMNILKNGSSKDRIIQNYNQIRFEPQSSVIGSLMEGCSFTYGDIGLICYTPCNVKNTIFRTTGTSVSMQNISAVSIENSIFQNVLDESSKAVVTESVDDLVFQKNIVLNNIIGLHITCEQSGLQGGLIKNNYFQNNSDTGIVAQYFDSSEISHNIIIGSYTGLTIIASTANIKYNIINVSVGVTLIGMYCYSTVTYNNFHCIFFGVRYLSRFGGQLNATHNYWGVSSVELIPDLIFDKNDIPTNDPYYPDYGFVLYSPFSAYSISSAGVEH
jgi:hypothetical protein